ncbi:MAG: thioredoxin family protein [Anaerolineae bacterium]|nr:thioredoxin family protein [Anaerolineae bacterium]
MMIERLIAALVLLAVGVVAYRLVIAWQIRRACAAAPCDPLLAGLKPGVATVLYFTTPMCAPCKTQQTPALERLKAQLGEAVQIVRVDATEQPDAAQRWGVLSVPTTFVLDGRGATLAVNNGVAEANKLQQQLGVR